MAYSGYEEDPDEFYYEEREKDEPDSKMMDYHPYSKGKNPRHSPGSDSQTLSYLKQYGYTNGKENFYDKVFTWLTRELKEVGSEVILALVPGHEANPNPGGLVHKIVQELQDKCKAEQSPLPFQDKLILVRTTTVPKSSTSEGPRSRTTHRETIQVSSPSLDCSGKVVVILDDVWTSGSTLHVCEEVIRNEYPNVKDVKLFAIGRTISI